MKRRVVASILFASLALGIAGCSGTEEKAPTVSEAQGVSSGSHEEQETQDPAEESEETFGVGDTVDIGGVAITLNSVTETSGNDFAKPEDGKTFALCNFTIANNSGADTAISSAMSFEAYCDDTKLSYDLTGFMTDEAQQAGQLDGNIADGKNMSGVVCYQVPLEYKKLEVYVKPNPISSDTADFEYNK